MDVPLKVHELYVKQLNFNFFFEVYSIDEEACLRIL